MTISFQGSKKIQIEIPEAKNDDYAFFYDQVAAAISYLKKEGIDIKSISSASPLLIIYSLQYSSDVKLHQRFMNNSDESNACFIPFFYSNSSESLIIYNAKKLENSDRHFVTSVLIHELTHYFDYIEIRKKFDSKFSLSIERWIVAAQSKVVASCIPSFQAYSEIHSKYNQELYYCKSVLYCATEGEVLEYMRNYMRKYLPSDSNDLHYTLYHLIAQFCAWDTLFGNKGEFGDTREFLNKLKIQLQKAACDIIEDENKFNLLTEYISASKFLESLDR